MKDRLEQLECAVEELQRRVDEISHAIRAGAAAGPDSAAPVVGPPPSAERAGTPARLSAKDLEAWVDRNRLVMLAGLVSLVMAGGMVLRILAISAPVPLAAGAGAGLAYCAILLVVAERAYRKGSTLHGDAFAVLAVLILDALLVEVARRPGGFSREIAFAVLGASVCVLSFLTVLHGRSTPFGVALTAAPVAGLLLGGKPFLHPHYAAILALTLLAGQAGTRMRRWGWARVGPAVISLLYLGVLWFISQAAARRDLPQHLHATPLPALCIFAGFFAVTVLPAAFATLFRRRRLDGYEIGIAITMAVTTFAGATSVLVTFPSGGSIAGGIAVGLSALCYLTSAISFRRYGSESSGFHAMATIAWLYALAGLALLLDFGGPLGVAYGALAAILAFSASHLVKRMLAFQANGAGLAAFFVLLLGAVDLTPPGEALAARIASAPWLLAGGVLAVATFALLRSFRKPGETGGIASSRTRRVAALVVLGTGVVLILAGALPFLARLGILGLGHGSGADRSDALWETLMTTLLVLGAVATLAAGIRLHEEGTVPIAAVLMGIGGVKVFLYDATRLPAAYLVGSSAVFGVGLLLCSFLYRRHRGLAQAAAVPHPREETSP